MTYQTIEAMLYPDGRVTLQWGGLPDRPVPVLITILGAGEEHALSEMGDYNERLEDYEERLARGEIRWQ